MIDQCFQHIDQLNNDYGIIYYSNKIHAHVMTVYVSFKCMYTYDRGGFQLVTVSSLISDSVIQD